MTAARLAAVLEVSLRTVYRDVADLSASGVPIAGEAGVGYRLQGLDLPPLMFDREEIEALVFGARVVQGWGDESLGRAAEQALAKIETVLPRGRSHLVEETRLYAPVHGERRVEKLPLSPLRRAIRGHYFVELEYRDEQGRTSRRNVRPLALAFYPPVWLLISWCELRHDFRNFRLDRMTGCRITGEEFPLEPGKALADYLARMAAEEPV